MSNLTEFNFRGFVEWLARDRQIISGRYYVGVVRAEVGNTKGQALRSEQQKLFAHLVSPKQNFVIKEGYIMSKDGLFTITDLPQKTFHLTARAGGYKPRSITILPIDSAREKEVIELLPLGNKPKKILIKGLPVHIAEEERLVLEKEGKTLKVEEYVQYAGKEIVSRTKHIDDLLAVWLDPEKRKEFLDDLSQKSVYPELIAEVTNRPDLDSFDILAQVAFGAVPLSRDDRAQMLEEQGVRFLKAFSSDAREVVHALLERYRLAGIEDIENPMVFELPPFDRLGGIREAERRFGTIDKLKTAIAGMRKRLYIAT